MCKHFLRGLAIIVLTLSFGVGSGVVFAASLEDGLAAARTGDYATAMKLWRPLAEQGNAPVQYALGVLYQNGQGVARD